MNPTIQRYLPVLTLVTGLVVGIGVSGTRGLAGEAGAVGCGGPPGEGPAETGQTSSAVSAGGNVRARNPTALVATHTLADNSRRVTLDDRSGRRTNRQPPHDAVRPAARRPRLV